jgi:hypothetical protein
MGRPLKIAKSQAVVTITATAAATDIVTTSANFSNLGITTDMPFVTATSVGGLVAGTTYWILEIINSGANSTFTVSATPPDANSLSEKVDLSATTGQTVVTTIGPVDTGYNNPSGASNTYGAVGGNTNQYSPTVLCRVKIGANAEANGWIVRQKGARKFLVSDGTNVGICVLANTANGSLAADTMTITATKLDTSTVRLKYLSDRKALDFSDNQYIASFNAAAAAPAGSAYEVVQVASL